MGMSALCDERKQTLRIHVNQTKPTNSCILWKANPNLGCKRSRFKSRRPDQPSKQYSSHSF